MQSYLPSMAMATVAAAAMVVAVFLLVLSPFPFCCLFCIGRQPLWAAAAPSSGLSPPRSSSVSRSQKSSLVLEIRQPNQPLPDGQLFGATVRETSPRCSALTTRRLCQSPSQVCLRVRPSVRSAGCSCEYNLKKSTMIHSDLEPRTDWSRGEWTPSPAHRSGPTGIHLGKKPMKPGGQTLRQPASKLARSRIFSSRFRQRDR